MERTQWRAHIGNLGFWAACAFSALALINDIVLVEFNKFFTSQTFIEQHPLFFVRALTTALLGCIVGAICSCFGEGMERAVGLVLSFVGIFLCAPLGAGY